MGAYILYKLEDSKETDLVNDFLDNQEEQKELEKFGRSLWFWSKADREFEEKKLKEKGFGCPDFAKIGEGKWKASGFSSEEEVCYDLVAKLFEKLQAKFRVKIYRNSCALRGNYYFTIEQTRMITYNGERLSS